MKSTMSHILLGPKRKSNSCKLGQFIYRFCAKLRELMLSTICRGLTFSIGSIFIWCAAYAQDIQVVYERSIPSNSAYDIHFITLTSGGEILLCGSGGGGGAWVGRFSPEANLIKGTVVEKRLDGAMEDCWTVVARDSDRTVIAGVTNSHALVKGDRASGGNAETYRSAPTAGLLALLSEDGATVFKKAFGNFKPYYQNGFYRGVGLKDGYLLLGNIAKEWPADSPSGVRGVPTIWLVKTDTAGNIIWQYEYAENDGDVMQADFHGFISDLVVLKDASVVFIPRASPVASTMRDGKPLLIFRGKVEPRGDRQQLILKIGSNGKELQRRAIPPGFGGDISLLRVDNQLVLIDHPTLNPNDKNKNVLAQIRVRRFDEELNLRDSEVVDLHGDEFIVQGAIAGGPGKILVIGNYVKDLGPLRNKLGEPALAEISLGGSFKIIQRFGSGHVAGIAKDANGDEFVVVRFGGVGFGESGENRRMFLTKFRLGR